jgi:heme exporter protein D
MQNTQPTAQPTWVDTHRPAMRPGGSSTLSTVWPSASSTSRRRAVLRRVFRSQARQAGQALSHRRQRGAQRGGQKVLQPPTSTVLGQGLGPQAQHPLLMAGSGTQRTQLAPDIRQVLQGQRARIHHCGWKPLFLMMRDQAWV